MCDKQLKNINVYNFFLNTFTDSKCIRFINSCYLQFTYDTKSTKSHAGFLAECAYFMAVAAIQN